jgi:hypothetical protein
MVPNIIILFFGLTVESQLLFQDCYHTPVIPITVLKRI